MQILDERWRHPADRERALLEHLIEFLQGFGAPPEDASLVRRKLEDLEELFLLVIVGEFNSGKSAFIKALLGEDELSREGVTPTTDRITVLKHGEEAVERERREGILEKEHPNDFLREVAIVDTPGTNAIIRHHEELSRGFVPRSDLVLFVTSSDRPFTESEREYLELIRDWGKKIVLVVNKVDLLRGEEDVAKVRRFVEEGVSSALNLKPPIFFVSSQLAQKAKFSASELEADALLGASGFTELERYVTDLLDEEGRVRLTLESPLGVVEELVRRYRLTVEERVSLLEDDFKMAENVESQLEAYREDMKRDFEARMAEIENIILSMNERGDEWFEENIRLANVRELVQREKVQDRFQREVVADTEALRERLGEVVRRQFGTELDRSVERMREAIAPYTRFVRTEHARMTEARSALAQITEEVESLRAKIAAPGVKSP